MLKRFLGSIKMWVISLFSTIQTRPQAIDNPVSTSAKQDIDPSPIHKEVEFFATENNLIDAFHDEPYVYGANETIFEGQKMRAINAEEPQYADEVPTDQTMLDHINQLRAEWHKKNNKGETITYQDVLKANDARKQSK